MQRIGKYHLSAKYWYYWMVPLRHRDKLTENNMAVIFAVDRHISSIYSELSKFIQGAEYVGHLTAFSSSLQNIVRKQYEEIKTTIREHCWK